MAFAVLRTAQVTPLDLQSLGFIAFTVVAALGFAGAVTNRAKLALASYRSGNRLELIRSIIAALIMALFVALAAYAAISRVLVTFVR
jgi:hypothetical protein